jgi:uncharacterized protein (TIGR03437 family)
VKRLFEACTLATLRSRPFLQVGRGRRYAGTIACLLACWSATAFAQNQPTPRPVRPLSLDQSRYRLTAGDRVSLAAPQETLDFIRAAKTRTVRISGAQGRGFVVAPNVTGDQMLLAASLTMKPGEYAVTVSAVSGDGEERAAAVMVTLDPLQTVPLGSTVPPVVLLNGLQLPSTLAEWLTFDSCPVSVPSNTFGPLATQLMESPSSFVGNPVDAGLHGAGVPVVYFFDNCVEDPNGLIENLGNTLGQVINLIQYSNGTQVPQVDLVSHSMGGLIVRSYLAGLQTSGALSPPLNPRVRKFIEIATPNFGSFLAANWSYVIANGTQTSEMIPGSPFLWYLATWNQRGDDLRGVDGLAIVGDAGYWQANNFSTDSPGLSDGVVSITSASLGFVPLSYARSPVRTRILPYCHVPPGSPIDCTGGGIAHVDQAPETGAIVLSFLENTPDWQSIGNSNQTQYGGLYFALENAAATQYTGLKSASLGSVPLNAGENASFFYNEFINGTGTLTATSTANQATNCGSVSVPGGYYSAVRCKFSPSIFSVQSNISTGLPGLTVAAGSTITISGTGFSAGTSVLVNGAALSAQIVSSQEITASLPNYSGLVGLTVSNSTGTDEINIFVAPPVQPPSISLSSTQLRFSYTVGGAAPATQTVSVTNSGGGTLTWSATSGASWLTVSPASGTGSGTLTLGINTAGLAAQTYNGAITVTASGAANSPQTIAVTLTVSAAAPSISLSASKASFSYTLGGSAPASQTVAVTNAGGGAFSWSATSGASWLTVSPASGTGSGTLTLGINPAGLSAQTYNGAITIAAAGATNNPQAIAVTLTVSAAAPPPVVVSAVVNAASWTGASVAPGELVVIGGTMLGPSTGVSGTVDPSTGKMVSQLAGTTVLFNGVAAPLLYASATQVNAIVPYETAGCTQSTLQVQYQGVLSSAMTLPCVSAAPGIFTFNASGSGPAAAANQDGTFNGPSSPAAAGSYVTLYFTGGGQTNPTGVTGSITGTSTLKWLTQAASVTVGGVAATVAFDGAAPTFVDGVLQLNIQLSPNTPSGSALPVVVTVGTIASPATATLAVK